MSLKTSKIASTPIDRFIKGLTMVLHSENIILSESERSLYEFILSHKNVVNSKIIWSNRRHRGTYWYLWELKKH
jgi:hypothetical protein